MPKHKKAEKKTEEKAKDNEVNLELADASDEGSEGGEPAVDGVEDLFCLCQQPYRPEKFMLECDNCHEWYHLGCLEAKWGILIFEFEAATMESFRCEKSGCDGRKISEQELSEWGGYIVNMRVDPGDKNPVLYQIAWKDGRGDPVWAPEENIPNSSLLEYRNATNGKATRKRRARSRSPVARAKSKTRSKSPASQQRPASPTKEGKVVQTRAGRRSLRPRPEG